VPAGILRLVRHPVYGGAILIGLGWLLADAPLGLVPTAYRARTPRRFVPWLY
jgi:protein-S-isoprenylcysteine O-methyltransferase Ste14